MQNLNWTETEARAKKMTDDELRYAIADCRECVRVMGTSEMIGKDANYYSDEGSVYSAELNRREAKRAEETEENNTSFAQWYNAEQCETLTVWTESGQFDGLRWCIRIVDSDTGEIILDNFAVGNGADILAQAARIVANEVRGQDCGLWVMK